MALLPPLLQPRSPLVPGGVRTKDVGAARTGDHLRGEGDLQELMADYKRSGGIAIDENDGRSIKVAAVQIEYESLLDLGEGHRRRREGG